MARKGISTAKPVVARGRQNDGLTKHKLSDKIHKNITALDRKLRKIAKLKSQKDVLRNLAEAEKLYDQLGTSMENHKKTYGSFPDWIQHDWVDKENFKHNGRVRKIMAEIKTADEKKLPKLQTKLFNTIRFATEESRSATHTTKNRGLVSGGNQ